MHGDDPRAAASLLRKICSKNVTPLPVKAYVLTYFTGMQPAN